MIRPLTKVGFSMPTFFDESTLSKGLNSPFIEIEHAQENAMEAELVEGERQEKPNGFGAITLAEVFAAADDDPELSIATAPIDAVTAYEANARPVLPQHDCKRAIERVEVTLLSLNESFDLSFRSREAFHQKMVDFSVADPTTDQTGVLQRNIA